MKTTCTAHGLERFKERVGVKSIKEAEHLASVVMERGDTFKDCSYRIDREFLQGRTKGRQVAYAYNGFCYIVDTKKQMVITVYQLPKSFGKRKKEYYEKDNKKYNRINFKTESLRICCEADSEFIEL